MTTKPDKKIRLQQAALACFIEHGFHATRIEDIIARAAMGKGTFYLYFKNKEDIVHTMLGEFTAMFEQIHHWLINSLDKSDLATLFEEEGNQIVEILQTNHDLAQFLFRQGRSIDADVTQKIDAFFEEMIDGAERSYRKGQELGLITNVDARTAAICVVGGVTQTYTLWLDGKIHEPIEVILQHVLDFYLKALLIQNQ